MFPPFRRAIYSRLIQISNSPCTPMPYCRIFRVLLQQQLVSVLHLIFFQALI